MGKLQAELNEKQSDIKSLAETFEREYEALRHENEQNVQELQRAFKENIERTRTPSVPKGSLNGSGVLEESPITDTNGSHQLPLQVASNNSNVMKPPMAPSSRQYLKAAIQSAQSSSLAVQTDPDPVDLAVI